MSFDPPKSRNEAILQNMLGANNVLETPKSREEELLLQILQQGGSGGGVTPEQIEAAVEAYLEEHPIDEPFVIPITQSGSTYTTTATAEDILANVDNCVLVDDGAIIPQATHLVSGSYAVIYFSLTGGINGYIDNVTVVVTVEDSDVSVDYYQTYAQPELPAVTDTDNGKFLRVINGAAAWQTVPAAESASFGGGA